jgi:predicted nucleic acid-binding Zn ribbon protein
MAQISLQQAMQELLKKSRFHQRIQALQIKDVWEEIMGKTIAQYTADIQLVENKLIITTHTAPLKQELMFQREKIKNRINEKLNDYAVHEVHIK